MFKSLNNILYLPVALLIVSVFATFFIFKEFDLAIQKNRVDLKEISIFLNTIFEAHIDQNDLLLESSAENINDIKEVTSRIQELSLEIEKRYEHQPELFDQLSQNITKYLETLNHLETHFREEDTSIDSMINISSNLESYQLQIEKTLFALLAGSNERIVTELSKYRLYLYFSYGAIILLSIMIVVQLSNYIIKPLKKLQKGLNDISHDSYMNLSNGRDDEIGELIEAFNDMSNKLRVSRERLTKANLQLKRSNEELEAFAYSVSHDLRTPLRSISGFSQALMDDDNLELPKQSQGYLDRVHKSALRMGELIDAILKLSRIGRKQITRSQVDLTALAKQLVDLMDTPESRRCQIEVEEDLNFYSDPDLTKVLMLNLLSNAIKFSSKEEAPKIHIGKKTIESVNYIFVKDNGVGFDTKYMSKVFGAFQRLHSSEEFDGMGIGLATVQKIVNKHGGEIHIESTVDEGTTVYFNLGNSND